MPTPYGRRHRRARKAMLCHALGTRCPGTSVLGVPFRSKHCDGIMTDPKRMHADHSVPVVLGGTTADKIICAPCNLGAGAALRNKLHAPALPTTPRHSRVW